MQYRGNFFRFANEPVEVSLVQEIQLAGDIELSSQFTTRTFRDVQKANELPVAVALVAFSDIGWHRKGGTLHLILHCEIATGTERLEDIHSQTATPLPNLQIFERLKRHILKPER
jgi:hypothetical protein